MPAFAACRGNEDVTAYAGANVIDGTGGPPILDGIIVVRNGRIEAIGRPDEVNVPRGATEIRLDGRWIIPGLVDGHAHVERWMLLRFLAYGVTSVRDLGGNQDSIGVIRSDILLGNSLGPRLFISGAVIDGQPASDPNGTAVTTANAARRAVDDRVLLDAAQVSLAPRFGRRMLAPLIDEANALEIPVAAHLGKIDGVTAAQFGVRSLEHMSGVVEATLSDASSLFRAYDDFFTGLKATERAWARLDSTALDRTARALVEHDVVIVPTLVFHEAIGRLADSAFISELDLQGVPDSVRDGWNLDRRAGIRRQDYAAFRRSRPNQDRFVRLFKAAGGRVVAGSETPNHLLAPGASLHRELELLVEAGLSPAEALLTATRDAAWTVDADSIGVLATGNLADFVVLNGNPLANISNTRRIDRVALHGELFFPEEFRVGW